MSFSPFPQHEPRLTFSHVDTVIVSPALRELLLVAVERTAAELAGSGGTSDSEIRETLVQLLRGIDAHEVGGAREQFADDAEVPAHYREALRNTLLELAVQDSGALSVAELAAVLMALSVRGPKGEEETNQFVRQIAKSNAVNAVVEIAHDMRSPLTSILFLVETLRRGRSGPVTPVQERQLGLIYGAALGLNTLACDVIDAVKGNQRLFDGRPIPFSIAEVILGVCDTVRPISEEKCLPMAHVLPGVDGRVGYPGALGRVLLNLMTNALKYTQEGSVSIGATELTDTRLRFWVSDTGQGIPEGVMGMLFDGFRPTSSGMRFSNAGLGLAICQDFLKSMGSSLEVESSPESGTRFSFELELQLA